MLNGTSAYQENSPRHIFEANIHGKLIFANNWIIQRVLMGWEKTGYPNKIPVHMDSYEIF